MEEIIKEIQEKEGVEKKKKEDAERIQATQVYPLQQCEHVYHGDCLREYFRNEINENRFPLTCPDVECRQAVMIADLQALLPSDLLEKYYSRTFNLAADV